MSDITDGAQPLSYQKVYSALADLHMAVWDLMREKDLGIIPDELSIALDIAKDALETCDAPYPVQLPEYEP